jgi:hypothetical protein
VRAKRHPEAAHTHTQTKEPADAKLVPKPSGISSRAKQNLARVSLRAVGFRIVKEKSDIEHKVGRCVSPPSKSRTGPDTPPALGLRAGEVVPNVPQTVQRSTP